MTLTSVNLANLRKVKNTVIGNPSAKLQLARDVFFIGNLIDCLNYPKTPTPHDPRASPNDIRIEAAHVIASLSYGSDEALLSLLRANAPRAFLYAIAHFTPDDPPALRSAFARALRALTVSIADVVGPSQWGLGPGSSIAKDDAKDALEFLFQLDTLDTLLPLLSPSPSPTPSSSSSTQIPTSIAQLLASAIRARPHRTVVAEWLPPADRASAKAKDTHKTRRGWEKTSSTILSGVGPGRMGGWVARALLGLVGSRDVKLQEAALMALASLTKENPDLASALSKPNPATHDHHPTPLNTLLTLTQSRTPDVQLAACLCLTHLLRALPRSHGGGGAGEEGGAQGGAARMVMNIVNRIIAPPLDSGGGRGGGGGGGVTNAQRTRACFVLYHLVTDDTHLCQAAFDRGCLAKLVGLVSSLPLPEQGEEEEEWSEPQSVASLREAALTTIAAISLFDNDVRRALTEPSTGPPLLPVLLAGLGHPAPGVRYASCQCVRAMSRAVAVLRTNIVDSGLGVGVWRVCVKRKEDRRVLGAALAAVCNMVNEFSPLRQVLLDDGLMPRLVEIVGYEEAALRTSALWAVKNLLCRSEVGTKRGVMGELGWGRVVRLMEDPDMGVREQALNVVRNVAENEEGIELVMEGVGGDVLLDRMAGALRTPNEDVVLQARFSFVFYYASYSYIHNRLPTSSRTSRMAATKAEARRPIVSCVAQLARVGPGKVRAAGFEGVLRHVCEWVGGGLGGRGGVGGVGWDGDREVVEQARIALHWLGLEL
ncbi:armadillo-type protein [Lyophyllum atratum]|nr:armadillo-type protein [Lyophyllum atratum]